MLLRQKPSFKDGLARPKRGKPIMYSTTRCDFLKRDKDFVSVEFRIFFLKVRSQFVALVSRVCCELCVTLSSKGTSINDVQ